MDKGFKRELKIEFINQNSASEFEKLLIKVFLEKILYENNKYL